MKEKEKEEHYFTRYDYEKDGLGDITDEYFYCFKCGTIRHYNRVSEKVKDFILLSKCSLPK